jgi:hypothetical protein
LQQEKYISIKKRRSFLFLGVMFNLPPRQKAPYKTIRSTLKEYVSDIKIKKYHGYAKLKIY